MSPDMRKVTFDKATRMDIHQQLTELLVPDAIRKALAQRETWEIGELAAFIGESLKGAGSLHLLSEIALELFPTDRVTRDFFVLEVRMLPTIQAYEYGFRFTSSDVRKWMDGSGF